MKARTIVMLCLIAILALPALASAEWVVETVFSQGDQGQYASIALDSEGIPHAAWFDASNAWLKYAYRDFDGWHVSTVDTGDAGRYASIAINPMTDLPAIAYEDDGDCKYASYSEEEDGWNIEVVAFNEDDNEGVWAALAFKSAGTPSITYNYANGAFHTIGINVVWKTLEGWSGHRLDSYTWPMPTGTYSAIAMSTADYPQIAYRDEFTAFEHQKFGWQDGSGWHIEDAITLDHTGEYADIAVDNGDNIYISSFDYTTLGDNCACLIAKVGGSWSKEEIDCGGDYDDFGKWTSIAIDSAGYPHLTYHGDSDLRYAVLTPDKGWDIAILDEVGMTGKWTGLALDEMDSPHILYYNETNKDVLYMFDLSAPTVSGIAPSEGPNTGVLSNVVVTGYSFQGNSTVKLINDLTDEEISGANVTIDSISQLTADFDLTGATPGLWDVQVTNSAGAGTLTEGFEVTTLPVELTAIDPEEGSNDNPAFTMTLTGNYFTPDATVSLLGAGEDEIIADAVTFNSLTEIEATFDLEDAAIGAYDVQVETDFGTDTLAEAFAIVCGEPIADFSGLPRTGPAPLAVQFSDESAEWDDCEIVSWEWDFGDGETSTDANPTHTYQDEGKYTVALTVTSAGGDNEKVKFNYITVNNAVDDDTTDDDVVDDDTAADDAADDDEADDDEADDDDLLPGDDDTDGAREGDDDDDDGCGC